MGADSVTQLQAWWCALTDTFLHLLKISGNGLPPMSKYQVNISE